jgi:hypothetical protein
MYQYQLGSSLTNRWKRAERKNMENQNNTDVENESALKHIYPSLVLSVLYIHLHVSFFPIIPR